MPDKGHFVGLPVRMFQLGDDLFVITAPYTFVRPSGTQFEVPVLRRGSVRLGLVTDGGTKPRIFAALIGSHTDRGFPGYVAHDAAYRLKPWGHCKRGRAIADLMLLEALEACGVTLIKRQIIYRFVRLFGGAWFRKPPVDLSKITAENHGPDFYPIPPDDHPAIRHVCLLSHERQTADKQAHQNARKRTIRQRVRALLNHKKRQ